MESLEEVHVANGPTKDLTAEPSYRQEEDIIFEDQEKPSLKQAVKSDK